MLFIVQFEDKPDVGELRQKLFQEHLAFLDSRKDRVLVPGGLREVPSDRPVGGLWIVDADDEDGVKAIFEDDPFWTNGLRASYRINRWVKAFPDRKVPI
ncbi:MAG TPA: YciI family protein [Gammaproteobacteria bacterium]